VTKSVLEKVGEELRANRTCDRDYQKVEWCEGMKNKTYLCGYIGQRGYCDIFHSVNASIPRPGCTGLSIHRAGGGKYMLEGLGEDQQEYYVLHRVCDTDRNQKVAPK
jgi:hypothetical protein